MTTKNTDEATYKSISALVDQWLLLHTGERFDLDTICRQLNLTERDARNLVTIKLAYEVKKGNLEKSKHIYIYVNKEIKNIEWFNSVSDDVLDIRFPYSHKDGTSFNFNKNVIIRPADLIVVAGVSNKGKSTFARNFLWENMDNFPCRMMVNEYAPGRFKSVVARMDWYSPMNSDGNPKFELIERHEEWQYAIEPDYVNIVDWINLKDNFYEIGRIMEGIQERLRGGICMIVLQKGEGKDLGRGGDFSRDLASFYVSIDSGRLTVVKAKETAKYYLDGRSYGFEIVDSGAGFAGIQEVVKCPPCSGTGEKWEKGVGKTTCQRCNGKGFIPKEEEI